MPCTSSISAITFIALHTLRNKIAETLVANVLFFRKQMQMQYLQRAKAVMNTGKTPSPTPCDINSSVNDMDTFLTAPSSRERERRRCTKGHYQWTPCNDNRYCYEDNSLDINMIVDLVRKIRWSLCSTVARRVSRAFYKLFAGGMFSLACQSARQNANTALKTSGCHLEYSQSPKQLIQYTYV